MAQEIITVFGGSGFVGRNVVRELARAGFRVRVAVRRPHEAHFLQPLGDVGQISLHAADARNEESVARVLEGAWGAINLVGILYQSGKQNFRAVHVKGAERIARLAAGQGLARVIHISAIGARPKSPSRYARSKAAGEAAMRDKFPGVTILRPSLVFGPEDEFFNRFAGLIASLPAFMPMPLLGGRTRFQPVHVDDVADAVVACLKRTDTKGRVFELGGPQVLTFRQCLQLVMQIIERRRALLPLPLFLAAIPAVFLGLLPKPPLTVDQVRLLGMDNVAGESGEEDIGLLSDLGIAPTAAEVVLPTYLWRFRPGGQYSAKRRWRRDGR